MAKKQRRIMVFVRNLLFIDIEGSLKDSKIRLAGKAWLYSPLLFYILKILLDGTTSRDLYAGLLNPKDRMPDHEFI